MKLRNEMLSQPVKVFPFLIYLFWVFLFFWWYFFPPFLSPVAGCLLTELCVATVERSHDTLFYFHYVCGWRVENNTNVKMLAHVVYAILGSQKQPTKHKQTDDDDDDDVMNDTRMGLFVEVWNVGWLNENRKDFRWK